MEKWIEANPNNLDKLQVFKNDFPEGLKNIIYKFAFALRKASEYQTEITFNVSKIKDVQDALFEYSKTNKKVELQTLSNGHFGFSYPENHRGSEWIKFRSTGLKSLTENTSSIAKQLGVNIDDARELGVAICAVLIYNRISKSQFLEDNYNKKIFKQIKTPTDIDKVIEFLKLVPEKFDICWNCGNTIVKNFDKITFLDFDRYTIHHKTKRFNDIKNHGSKLANLNQDKWNPADLFFIKKNNKISDKLKLKSIFRFNSYISSNYEVIGISLKESESGALHGSISGRSFLSNLIGPGIISSIKSRVPEKFNNSFKKEVETFFGNLKFFSSKGIKIRFLAKENPKEELLDLLKRFSQNSNLKTADGKAISSNFFISISESIVIFNEIFKEAKKSSDPVKSLTEIFKLAYQFTSSQLSKSCGYEKVMGTTWHRVQNKEIKKFSVDGIYIPCDGETQILTTTIVENKKYTLQLRSKGSNPQFILLAKYFNNSSFKRFF